MEKDEKIVREAFLFFSAEWQRVPMGPSEFLDRAWRSVVAKTDEKFGHGYGQWAAKMWHRDALRRMENK